MPPKRKNYHVGRADDNDNHDLNQVQARAVVLQKGRRWRLKITPQSMPVHQNPILSQGDWVYQFDPTDSYDPHAAARVCQLPVSQQPQNDKSIDRHVSC